MVSTQMKNAYTEVYIILNKLELISKIPDYIINKILKEKNDDHFFDFNIENSLYEQIENSDTISIISYLYIKYLCDDKEEKEWIISRCNYNEIQYQEKLKEKYNYENLFKSTSPENNKKTDIIEYKKKNIFWKIIDELMSFFKKF